MGSPDFSVPVLVSVLEAGHDVINVYTQPPRPAGRGQHERRCPVHAYASERGLQVHTPESFKMPESVAEFCSQSADIAVVVAYGLILPKPVLEFPRLGCINVHASLLPRWRGAAPIHRALLAGDDKTGVCIMQMEEGLDTGPVLLRQEIPITPETVVSGLHDHLSDLGATLINPALEGLANGTLISEPQAGQGITYAKKLDKSEGAIDWRMDADEIDRKIRAFTPWPGVWFTYKNERIKVLACVIEQRSPVETLPGTVLDTELLIACGSGFIRPTILQRPGKKALAMNDFLKGYPIRAGTRLN